MKEFIKKYSLVIAIVISIVFLTIFLTFLFQKRGDTVYIAAMTGKVSVGSSSDTSTAVEGFVGMKLDEGDIVMTGDRASCVLSYEKKSGNKDNFITICEDSQINIYGKNKQGGYNFFVTYGSVISNMAVQSTYTTNIASKLFSLSADGLIMKIDYDKEESLGNIYVFDGNGTLQIIQPSGSNGKTERLIKNSATAVKHMDDGTVGFGQLNCPFGLDSFSAQDLKIMSGVANNWSEKISYGVDEFEKAFQTAADYAEFMQVDPVEMTTVSETEYIPETLIETTIDTTVTEIETTVLEQDITTKFMGATQTVPGASTTRTEINADGSIVYKNGETMAFSEFARSTVMELNDVVIEEADEEPIVTTVPVTSQSDDETKTKKSRVTDTYVPAITTAGGTNVTTSGNSKTTKKTGVTTTVPKSTSDKKQVVTTTPITTIDPNTTHTVIFTYSESGHEYWAIQLVKHGASAIAPDVPEIEGKHFQCWDKDFSCVTSDMTINGVFNNSNDTSNYYTVTFYADNSVWKSVKVKHGGDIKLISKPEVKGKTFIGWNSSLNNITSDKTVFALFSE